MSGNQLSDGRFSVQTLLQRVGDQNLPFGQRLNSVRDVMMACQEQMMSALPRHVTPDRMIRVAINCIRKTPKLLECSPASLFGAITEAATYGWELGGVLGHAYLVPFGNDCQLIPGYKGLIDLCRRSGTVSTIVMESVHEGDRFSYELGDDPHIKHTPSDSADREKQPVSYVYVAVKLRDGGTQRAVWPTSKVDEHKERYSTAWRRAEDYRQQCIKQKKKIDAKKLSAWHTEWVTMAKKTVIRDMISRGLIPVSSEYQTMLDRGDPDYGGGSPPTIDADQFGSLQDLTGDVEQAALPGPEDTEEAPTEEK